MSDDPGEDIREQEDIDPGVAVAELAGFEHHASTGLLSRFRRAVQRRAAVAQLTNFSTGMPLAVLMEFWLMLVEQLSPKSTRKDTKRGDETS